MIFYNIIINICYISSFAYLYSRCLRYLGDWNFITRGEPLNFPRSFVVVGGVGLGLLCFNFVNIMLPLPTPDLYFWSTSPVSLHTFRSSPALSTCVQDRGELIGNFFTFVQLLLGDIFLYVAGWRSSLLLLYWSVLRSPPPPPSLLFVVPAPIDRISMERSFSCWRGDTIRGLRCALPFARGLISTCGKNVVKSFVVGSVVGGVVLAV